jgi:hypothetical protein
MKITKAIMSVDDNPLYSDFWSPVSKVWKERFNIEPVLIYFGDKELDSSCGQVKKVKPVEGFPLYLQTQWARFWYTTLEPETNFIVSDIDMFPISFEYFVKQIEDIGEDKYVHLGPTCRPMAVCYHVAKGKMFKRVLGMAESFSDSLGDLSNSNCSHNSYMGFEKWGIEEAYCTQQIENYKNKDELVMLPRKPNRRIDRSYWHYNREVLREKDYYIDCHSVRPYSEYKTQIDEIVEILTK